MRVVKTIIIILMLGTIGFIVYRAANSSSLDYTKTVNAQVRDIEKRYTEDWRIGRPIERYPTDTAGYQHDCREYYY